MTRLTKSRDYFQDLKRIDDYISNNLLNPRAAKKIIFEIEDAVNNIDSFPKIGKVLSIINKEDTGFRYILHKEYIIFYKPLGETVHIDRVFSTKEDYMEKMFGKELD